MKNNSRISLKKNNRSGKSHRFITGFNYPNSKQPGLIYKLKNSFETIREYISSKILNFSKKPPRLFKVNNLKSELNKKNFSNLNSNIGKNRFTKTEKLNFNQNPIDNILLIFKFVFNIIFLALRFVLSLVAYILFLPFKVLFLIFNSQWKVIRKNWLNIIGQGRVAVVRIGFVVVFSVTLIRLADLQLLTSAGVGTLGQNAPDISLVNRFISAKRGQIYISDINQNRSNIALTTTKISGILWFNPKNFQAQVKNGLDKEQALTNLASSVNIDIAKLKENVENELKRENLRQYAILFRGLDSYQKQSANYLITDRNLNRKFGFSLWLGIEDRESRFYPEGELLASTIGYTPNYSMPSQDALKRAGCEQMVIQNQARQTDRSGFVVGEYGIEQKYCSVLSGVNGRRTINNNQKENQTFAPVIDGADIYLTIDKTLQRQAELILDEAMEKNRATDGTLPRDGCILVTEVQTGKILAMATAPSFDPNNYQRAFVETPMALRNICTNDDYEVGSVMKPMAVAAALDLHSAGITDKNSGKRMGVSADFKFTDYDRKGKLYRENNGNIVPLRNAEGASFQDLGEIGLKECIRDSINTCIADVAGSANNRFLMNYFVDRFLIGKETKVDLPGDLNGNINSFERDLLCDYCWATKSFGQGFSMSPLQLVRAYTPIANNGLMVEPYLINKIECSDGSVETFQSRGSCVPSNLALGNNNPKSVISKSSANLVAGYMQAVLDEGFKGTGRAGGKVEGYKVAAKSGTAQVSRPIVDKNGNFIKTCNQVCNTEKGIYDHTYTGFNLGNKRYMVLVKISEPKRGLVKNFSSETVAPFFAKMMSYTLSYMGVPKDR